MPDHMGEVPSRGCEVFVGKIPRDLFEDEIFPVFEKIGPIYELRLMMDFDGRNRGFCFVMFTKVGFLIYCLTKLPSGLVTNFLLANTLVHMKTG